MTQFELVTGKKYQVDLTAIELLELLKGDEQYVELDILHSSDSSHYRRFIAINKDKIVEIDIY